jgi:hypothetical protein
VLEPLTDVSLPPHPDDFYRTFDNATWVGPSSVPNPFPTETFGDPGIPVLIDPIGFHTKSGSDKTAVASDTNFPRRNIGTVDGVTTNSLDPQSALRNCVMLDDWTFVENGLASTTGGVTRVGKYNWAVVLQRLATAVPGNRPTSMSILCFGERPPLLNAPDMEKLAINVGLTQGSTRVTGILKTSVDPTDPNAPRLLRKGGWVMDGSIDTSVTPEIRNARFYRITNVDERPATYDIEIEPPLVDSVAATPTNRRLFFFAGLTEVFQRPPLPGN